MSPRKSSFALNWMRRTQQLRKEAHLFYLVCRHPRTRWYTRLIAAAPAAYLVSPIQLIPNFIPVIGCLDDLLVLFVGAKVLRRITPADVLAECRQLADAAETRRNEDVRWTAAFLAPALIVTVWLLMAIGASTLLAAYIYH
jgi:uncharacterized membrane protein YkvA (DUF1232 family)